MSTEEVELDFVYERRGRLPTVTSQAVTVARQNLIYNIGMSVEKMLHGEQTLTIHQAKELLFTGGRLIATQALTAGMVNRVAPRAELDAQTMELAQRIAKSPPFAMKLIKRSLNRSQDVQGMREAMSAHFDLHQLSHVSDEYQATVRAGLTGAIRKNHG